ncbi:hypothetical protein [Noviherbaspirillum galbum]|uniref:hypothetical protein n=1 Tax=Noviherbaspirillum galbum TaxID=2709383 RepID=UPI002E2B228E|nr:hypothetical protein [Noviherbaspirillum galbum]
MTTTIIAGRFQQQSAVDEAVDEFTRAGFARDRISAFFVNPQGQHDTYPIGGDHDRSPGAGESGQGVAAGAAAGGAIGLAAAPILGPVGTITGGLLGAHIGGLVGSMAKMKDRDEHSDHPDDVGNEEPIRRSGMMLAIAVEGEDQMHQAVNLLRSLAASDIELAEGTITEGDWTDFNPDERPHLIGSPEQATSSSVPSDLRRL